MLAQTTTHATLLARVTGGQDPQAWREFCDRYEELIRGFALRRGAIGADADDIVQDVLMSLAKVMPGFSYDPSKGKFRSYLKTAVIRAVAARFRQTGPARSIEMIGDPSDPGLGRRTPVVGEHSDEESWEAEWRQYHLRQAMKSIQAQFSESDLAAFEAYAAAGRDASSVASELGLSVDQVYQAKSRIMRKLSIEIAKQVEEEG